MKTLRILAVDDHEMTMIGYKFILEEVQFENFKIQVDTAKTYDLGKHKITESAKSFPYDIIMLDIQLGPANETQPHTGED
ncbi:MAG: histidine kinase, partial [Flavobacteriales bacterium]